MEILQHPHAVLAQVAKPYDLANSSQAQRMALARKLAATLMAQKHGQRLGLAAPQIGIDARVILVMGRVMFNPEWRPVSNVPLVTHEGCYSLPKSEVYEVNRVKYGWAKWYDDELNFHEEKLTELTAIVFQHELSHLEGKCCIDIGRRVTIKE